MARFSRVWQSALRIGHPQIRWSMLVMTHNGGIPAQWQGGTQASGHYHEKRWNVAFLEFVFAFLLSLGFQLTHKATCHGGGCLTRHSHYARLRLGGVTIWRIQCTTCKAVFTVLPHFILRYRQMRPDVARDALLATHG